MSTEHSPTRILLFHEIDECWLRTHFAIDLNESQDVQACLAAICERADRSSIKANNIERFRLRFMKAFGHVAHLVSHSVA